MTLDLSTAWDQVSQGKLIPQMPSGLSSAKNGTALWQQEMADPQSRKVAFLYQLYRERGTDVLLGLEEELSCEDFGKLLSMTPKSYRISRVSKMSLQTLVADAFVEHGYGTFEKRATTFCKALPLADLTKLTPLFRRYIKDFGKRDILQALLLAYVEENNPRVRLVRTMAWQVYLEGANVSIIDSGYAAHELCLSPQEARNMVAAAQSSPDLRKLILKNYKLSQEAMEILKGSPKEIDIRNCEIATSKSLKIAIVSMVALFTLAAVGVLYDTFRQDASA